MCRVYSLVQKKWVELGEGNVLFRKKTTALPSSDPSLPATTYSSVRMSMNDTKTGSSLINHTGTSSTSSVTSLTPHHKFVCRSPVLCCQTVAVHPRIELKSNGERSWTWTIVQKVADPTNPALSAAAQAAAQNALNAAAAGQAPEIKDGKQTLTYAFKFKTADRMQPNPFLPCIIVHMSAFDVTDVLCVHLRSGKFVQNQIR